MKKLLLLTAILLGLQILGTAQIIKGSDTMLPLSQKLAEQYMKANKGKAITVNGGGSGVGIAALMDGTTDLAMASRRVKFTEKQKMQESGKTAKEVIIAYDALAVIVNLGNKVTNLTREQLEAIFTGKITNWKQVGGEDMKIVCYSRETSSGTYEFFKENVLKNKNYMNGIMSMPATGAIMQSVGQTKGAIAYVGLAYLNKNVKAIHVSYDKGKTYIVPSIANAKNKTYPIVRPLFYYYEIKIEKRVKPYLDYVLSPEGQKIVTQVGYIPVK